MSHVKHNRVQRGRHRGPWRAPRRLQTPPPRSPSGPVPTATPRAASSRHASALSGNVSQLLHTAATDEAAVPRADSSGRHQLDGSSRERMPSAAGLTRTSGSGPGRPRAPRGLWGRLAAACSHRGGLQGFPVASEGTPQRAGAFKPPPASCSRCRVCQNESRSHPGIDVGGRRHVRGQRNGEQAAPSTPPNTSHHPPLSPHPRNASPVPLPSARISASPLLTAPRAPGVHGGGSCSGNRLHRV